MKNINDIIKTKIVNKLDIVPDVYIQVTIPNEFRRFGKFNIGITAGIETTVAPKDWVDGCNQMEKPINLSSCWAFAPLIYPSDKYCKADEHPYSRCLHKS